MVREVIEIIEHVQMVDIFERLEVVHEVLSCMHLPSMLEENSTTEPVYL